METFFLLEGIGVVAVSVIVARSNVIFCRTMKVSCSIVVPGGSGLPGVLGTGVFLGDWACVIASVWG